MERVRTTLIGTDTVRVADWLRHWLAVLAHSFGVELNGLEDQLPHLCVSLHFARTLYVQEVNGAVRNLVRTLAAPSPVDILPYTRVIDPPPDWTA
jgi:hypothetical protein